MRMLINVIGISLIIYLFVTAFVDDLERRLLRALWGSLVRIACCARLGIIFVFYLLDEWLRGPRGEAASTGETPSSEDEDEGQADLEVAYAGACLRLGLMPGFTRAELRRAYKETMKSAHPDAGGSVALAQGVNEDRDFIMRYHDWK